MTEVYFSKTLSILGYHDTLKPPEYKRGGGIAIA